MFIVFVLVKDDWCCVCCSSMRDQWSSDYQPECFDLRRVFKRLSKTSTAQVLAPLCRHCIGVSVTSYANLPNMTFKFRHPRDFLVE